MSAAHITQRHNGNYAYVSIETATKSLDIALRPGVTPAESLRIDATDKRAQAQRLIAQAELLEGVAADILATPELIAQVEQEEADLQRWYATSRRLDDLTEKAVSEMTLSQREALADAWETIKAMP